MKNYERGQILLIVVLVMTIALTIGLSLATRTITDIRTSTEEENSQKAFSAAEAGLERALQTTTSLSGTFTNNTTYQTSINTVAGTEILLSNGVPVLKDEPVDLWLSVYPTYTTPRASNPVTIYWGNSSDVCQQNEATNSQAALEIILISGTKTTPQLTHYPVDPCAGRVAGNKFESIPAGGGTVAGKVFAFKKTIPITSGLLMRIIPLYASTPIAAKGCDGANGNCAPFLAQGTVVSSVGTANNTQRRIVGLKEYPKLPVQLFPYIIFSPR